MLPEPRDGWEVHLVPAYRAHKDYTCPGCPSGIGYGQGHVVAWPCGDNDDRRHWHKHCWRLVARRGW
jgi:hypothetical protein